MTTSARTRTERNVSFTPTDAINFNDTEGRSVAYTPHPDIPVNLVTSPFFTTNLLQIDEKVLRDYSEFDTFVVIIAAEGGAGLVWKFTAIETYIK